MSGRGSRVSPVLDNSNDGLRRAIESLEQKFDNFIQSLQDRFITRPEHEQWRMSVEQRLTTIEAEQRLSRQWENDEHTKLAAAVVEAERRIIEKLDEKNTDSWGTRITTLIAVFGWVLTLAVSIVGWFLLHH